MSLLNKYEANGLLPKAPQQWRLQRFDIPYSGIKRIKGFGQQALGKQ